MKKTLSLSILLSAGLVIMLPKASLSQKISKPNVIYIYADDLGFGDLSSYGAQQIETPNLDKLAKSGTRFTNAHSSSATCTPSRFALMTGTYPWRQDGTGVLPGDAKLIVPTDKITLPKVFKNAGYTTAIVGKWHMGLGNQVKKDWNAAIKPGPNDVGFDYSFIFPATADRVPTVFLENGQVMAAEASDPILVDYDKKVGNDPTGKEHPELLKMQSSPGQGHNQTIVNGIGRIGYMSGGKRARWVDEEVSTTFLHKAQDFISQHQDKPFFLYFCLTEPHVPRMPATQFKGKSKLGYRGDAILQLDWTVGQIQQQLQLLGLDKNTIVIFSSDNGPVLDDGYVDGAVAQQNGHQAAGPLRGGKYSIFEGGTRVPFIVSGQGVAQGKVSDALISQIDLLATSAQLVGVNLRPGEAKDSEPLLKALTGQENKGRASMVQHAYTLAIVKDNWKYIAPSKGTPYMKLTDTETGNLPEDQLYDLKNDIGEKNNVADRYPEKVAELKQLLEAERKK
ncbi:sulfatase-like hydrolase/transferase [Sphingobacterium sp. N143]|uniref:sulfatase-like hydrolase/transferase n=1 Tax=Sphingobacterium sp. N143 TaxID=2746727 RepID=UPI0025767EBB|nr:sulfatase-like hydrolase/transferase [Sphingobacterium sp. N143]MDM1294024.1 sulfatase-like hydrolase/transferase [Sphingobacterium sp. N143]